MAYCCAGDWSRLAVILYVLGFASEGAVKGYLETGTSTVVGAEREDELEVGDTIRLICCIFELDYLSEEPLVCDTCSKFLMRPAISSACIILIFSVEIHCIRSRSWTKQSLLSDASQYKSEALAHG